MDLEIAKRALLDYGWDAAERRRIAELLRCLAESGKCQAAVTDYDRLRSLWKPTETDAEPEGGWEAFDVRLGTALAAPRPLRWVKIVGLAAALVATFVLARYTPGSAKRPGVANAPSGTNGLAFSAPEIAADVSVFRQVADVFDHQAAWVQVSDRAAELGLGVEPGQIRTRLLLVRLALLDGVRVVCQTDLVIVPGQAASVTVPFEHGRRVQFQVATRAEDPTRPAIWAEIQGPGETSETVAALATELAIPFGQVRKAGEMVTPTGGYELRVAFARSAEQES